MNCFYLCQSDRNMSKIIAAVPEPEIDAEWMKFMSRITRQQNCDTADVDNDSGDDDDDDDCGVEDARNNAAGPGYKKMVVSDTPAGNLR